MNVGESFAYEEYERKSLLSISWVAHAFTSDLNITSVTIFPSHGGRNTFESKFNNISRER